MKSRVSVLVMGFCLLALTACGQGIPGDASSNPEFWKVHGIWFLVFMNLFPRITMLVATAHPVGWLAWIGWLIAPRVLAAILATYYYWDTNPVLCIITWFVALGTTGGTSSSGYRKVNR